MSAHVDIAGAQYLRETTQGGIIYLTHGFRECTHSLCSVASGPLMRGNVTTGACGPREEMETEAQKGGVSEPRSQSGLTV